MARGLHTIADIAAEPLPSLQRAVGAAAGAKLHDLAWGIDPRIVAPHAEEKSVGHEVTFDVDIADAGVLRRELFRQANQVAVRLREAGLVGRTVVLKLRYADFSTITRSRTLAEPTDLGRRIYEEVRASYDALGAHPLVRLIGVRVEQLAPRDGQALGLWDEDDLWREAERTVDNVSERFGRGALGPASLLRPAREVGPSKRRPRLDD